MSSVPASASTPAELDSGPRTERKNVAGEKSGCTPSAGPIGARTASQTTNARMVMRSRGPPARVKRTDDGDQHEPCHHPRAARVRQLLGGPLLDRHRLNAEEQMLPGGGRLLVIEHLHGIRGGAGRENHQVDFGALAEELGEAAGTVGNRRMGPDEHIGDGDAAARRVAPRLELDVISSRPGADRIALRTRRQPMAPGPRPRLSVRIEHDDAHFRTARGHHATERLECGLAIVARRGAAAAARRSAR